VGSAPTAGGAHAGGPVYAEPFRLELAGDPSGAAGAWNELDCPYESALALLFTTDEAAVRRSLSLLDDLAAVAPARIARQRLRELGARSIPTGARATTRAHPLGLTRREREVLDLICAGRTNAEIAAELFISAKTVDHHVSAVLGKLGTPTRNAAAAEAARLGLVGLAEK
jgi:DNA-binding CsgD family transcriptional regulator